MTRVVYKHNLPLPGSMLQYRIARLSDALPVVHVGMQGNVPTFWFETSQDERNGTLEVTCIGTGWNIPDETQHIGTLAGGYVWHYYARWV